MARSDPPSGPPIPAQRPLTRLLGNAAFIHGYRFENICLSLSCTPRHLHRIFLRDIGISPKEWLKSRRMVTARRMLDAGRWPSQVAPLLGFATPSNFGREFKATYGVTPGQYYEKARERRTHPPTSEPQWIF